MIHIEVDHAKAANNLLHLYIVAALPVDFIAVFALIRISCSTFSFQPAAGRQFPDLLHRVCLSVAVHTAREKGCC